MSEYIIRQLIYKASLAGYLANMSPDICQSRLIKHWTNWSLGYFVGTFRLVNSSGRQVKAFLLQTEISAVQFLHKFIKLESKHFLPKGPVL